MRASRTPSNTLLECLRISDKYIIRYLLENDEAGLFILSNRNLISQVIRIRSSIFLIFSNNFHFSNT
jgi:hypothetical protein